MIKERNGSLEVKYYDDLEDMTQLLKSMRAGKRRDVQARNVEAISI